MMFSDLLPEIDAKWHADFVRFIETGEASDGFLDDLESDERCQKVMERLLATQVRAVKPIVTAKGSSPIAKTRKAATRRSSPSPSARPSAVRRRRRTVAHR